MFPQWGLRRQVETGIRCTNCNETMTVGKTWHDVALWCKSCNHKMTLEDAIPVMDTVMENFLESVYCDRM